MPSGVWLVAYIALWILLLLETALIVGLIRHVASLNAHYVRNDPDAGLPIGVLAPTLLGFDLQDRPVALGADGGRKTLIYFLSTGCPTCREVMHRAYRLSQIEGVDLVLNIIASKTRTELFVGEFWRGFQPGFATIIPDRHRDNYDRYQITSVPFAVLVDEDGRIGGKGSVIGYSDVARMIEQSKQLRLKRLAPNGSQPEAEVAAAA